MGFILNLLAFPFLILFTGGLVIYYFILRKKIALWLLGGIWVMCIGLVFLTSIFSTFRTPIRLTREEIVGEYRIDKKLYPGKNASWQYEHFRFLITKEDSIIFFAKKPGRLIESSFRHKLVYKTGPPDIWTIDADSTHHVIQISPTLFRSHNRFYYVFYSSRFGNMFFRKVAE